MENVQLFLNYFSSFVARLMAEPEQLSLSNSAPLELESDEQKGLVDSHESR